jgi:hypothetical protein
MADTEPMTEDEVRGKLLSAIGEAAGHKNAWGSQDSEALLQLAKAFALVTGSAIGPGQGAAFVEYWRSQAERNKADAPPSLDPPATRPLPKGS